MKPLYASAMWDKLLNYVFNSILNDNNFKFAVLVVLFGLGYFTINLNTKVDELVREQDQVPELIRQSGIKLYNQLYGDGKIIAEDIIGALISANENVIRELEIEQSQKERVLREIRKEFKGISRRVERLELEGSRSKGLNVKPRIEYDEINGIFRHYYFHKGNMKLEDEIKIIEETA